MAPVPDDPYDAEWSDPAEDHALPGDHFTEHGWETSDDIEVGGSEESSDHELFTWGGADGDRHTDDQGDDDDWHSDDTNRPDDPGSDEVASWDEAPADGVSHEDEAVDGAGAGSASAGAAWSDLVGYGGVDPGAREHDLFDTLGTDFGASDDTTSPLSIDDLDRREWLAEHHFIDATWARPGLLDAGQAHAAADGVGDHAPAEGLDVLTGLWERLNPDVDMPLMSDGTPDVEASLAALESGSGATGIVDVVAAVRRALP